MKKTYFSAILILSFISVVIGKEISTPIKRKVVISGKIKNNTVQKGYAEFYISRIGLEPIYIKKKFIGEQSFSISFETYIPKSVTIRIDKPISTGFAILVHPGDNIRFEMDTKNRSIVFKGDSKKTNEDAIRFQTILSTHPDIIKWKSNFNKNIKLDYKEFLICLDKIRSKCKFIYNDFVKKYSPNSETKIYASMIVDSLYYNGLSIYPLMHKRFVGKKWDVPLSYYDRFLELLPINKEMYINAGALSSLINKFHHGYVDRHITDTYNSEKGDYKEFYFNGIIKHTKDPLMRQLVLTEFFFQDLNKLELDFFRKNQARIKKLITEPYLIRPLIDMFHNSGKHFDLSKLDTKATSNQDFLKTIDGFLPNLLNRNKGKAIYIDCWATWCKACTKEMPKSKELIHKYKEKDVAFVFINIDSQKKTFRAMLDKLNIDAQHYYLTKEQSIAFREKFKIVGIPYYILIDKAGKISEKGNHLRPIIAASKIEALLK